MARGWAVPATVAFAAYAAVMLRLEWTGGQDRVRPYFADIEPQVFLHAVNTTLSAGLLGIAAVLSVVAWRVARLRGAGAAFGRLAALQALWFGWAALDDRFSLHERLPAALEPAYWLAFGGSFAVLLGLHRACLQGRGRAAALLALGGVLFAAMLVVDLLAPADARLRLSVEDLLKAAASLALAGWTWRWLEAELALLRR